MTQLVDHRWHGDEFKRALRAHVGRQVEKAAIVLAREVRTSISTPGTGKVKGRRIGPVVHSRPGQSPFKQTGRLRASIEKEVNRITLIARVGTSVKYGRRLELGTRRMKARPYLRRTLRILRPKLTRIIAHPMPGMRGMRG